MSTLHGVTATCKEASGKFQAAAANYKNNLLNYIPSGYRENILLRVTIAASFLLPTIYFTDESPSVINRLFRTGTPIIVGIIDYVVITLFANNKSEEIKQTIEGSRLGNKDGVALILTATADHNFAFAEGDSALWDIKILAKRFLIESKTIATSQQAIDAIEGVCKASNLPVKVVCIQGHGMLQAVQLSHGP